MAHDSSASKLSVEFSQRDGQVIAKLVSQLEAIELLRNGDTQLVEHQQFPPMAILESLWEQANSEELWGPSITSPQNKRPKLLQTIDEKLFGQASLRTFVDGEELRWFYDHWDFVDFIEAKISKRCGLPGNMITGLFSILNHHLDRNEMRVKVGSHRPNEFLEQGQIVERRYRGRPVFFADPEFHKVSNEWWPFASQLHHLDDLISKGFQTALQECRVIAAHKPEGGTFAFAAPSLAAQNYNSWHDENCGFLDTRDLPNLWFGKSIERKQQDLKLQSFLKKYIAHSRRTKKCARMEDLRTAIVNRFGVSEAQARRSINDLGDKLPKLSSRPAKNETIDFKELDSLFQGWSV